VALGSGRGSTVAYVPRSEKERAGAARRGRVGVDAQRAERLLEGVVARGGVIGKQRAAGLGRLLS